MYTEDATHEDDDKDALRLRLTETRQDADSVPCVHRGQDDAVGPSLGSLMIDRSAPCYPAVSSMPCALPSKQRPGASSFGNCAENANRHTSWADPGATHNSTRSSTFRVCASNRAFRVYGVLVVMVVVMVVVVLVVVGGLVEVAGGLVEVAEKAADGAVEESSEI